MTLTRICLRIRKFDKQSLGASQPLSGLPILYDRIILSQPKTVLFVLVTVLLFFGYHAKNFTLDASADSLLLENDIDLKKYREINQRYPTDDFLIVTFSPHKPLFTDESLTKLKQLRDELEAIPAITSIVSLLDVPLVASSDISIAEMIESVQTLESEKVDREKAREELLSSPVYRELIIDINSKTTAILLNLKSEPELGALLEQRNQLRQKRLASGDFSNAEQKKLMIIGKNYDLLREKITRERQSAISLIRTILNGYRDAAIIHLGGVPMITNDMVSYIRSDLIVFGAGVLVILALMLSILFRQKRWVVLPLISCFYAGLIMIGILGFVGWKVTVISSNFLALMLIITISMNIHLIVRYRQLLEDNPDFTNWTIVQQMVRRMVTPCFYTSLTSIIGFGSLAVSGIKPVMDFGWMMSAGLTTTFITSFTLFPSLLLLMGKPKQQSNSRYPFFLTNTLAKIVSIHGRKVIVICVLTACVCAVGILQLRVENSFINYFRDSTEIHQSLRVIDQELGGTTPLEIIFKLEDTSDDLFDLEDMEGLTEEEMEWERQYQEEIANSPQYWFTPEKIERIKTVHDYFESMPEVGKVLSLASPVRVAEALNDGQPLDSFQLALLYTKLPDQVKSVLIDPYVSIDHDEARVLLRIRDTQPELRRNDFLNRVNDELRTELHFTSGEVQVAGLLVLYNNMLQSLFDSQIATLGVVMIGIAVMFLILFRSITLATIGILPNLLGAVFVLGFMGWTEIPLDMMTITIAAITIGIAVDNGIHYIYRFREEVSLSGDYNQALYASHKSIGRAIAYTTLTIVVGFSILVLSKFIPTILFGLLTATAMCVALLSALTLLPKLILWWHPFPEH